MRRWAIASAVLVLLLLIPLRIEYRLAHPTVPPGFQRSECLTPAAEGGRGGDRLEQLGGRTTRYPNAQWGGNSYTIPDIAQGRCLDKFDKLELTDREHFHPWEREHSPILAQARSFLWDHWEKRKRAYLILTLSSVDRTTTAHIFIEPDDSGRWRVYWRMLTPGSLTDEPTAYSVTWITPSEGDRQAALLPTDRKPDPMNDRLEFHDVCGEEDGEL